MLTVGKHLSIYLLDNFNNSEYKKLSIIYLKDKMYQNIGIKVTRAVCLHSSWPRPASTHASKRHAPCVVQKVSVNKLYLSVKDPWQPLMSSRHAVALTVISMSQWTIFSHSHYIRERKDPVDLPRKTTHKLGK